MPYAILPGDQFTVTVVCSDTDQVGENTVKLQCDYIAGAGITDQQVLDQISVEVAALYPGLLYNGAQYNGVTMRRTRGAGVRPVTKYSSIGSAIGTAGAVALPRQTCGLVQLRTDFGGKQHQARHYIPFPADADNELNGRPKAAYRGNVAAIGTYLKTTGILTSGASVLTYTWGMAPNAVGPIEPFVASSVPKSWATQRRRGDFGQRNRPPL